MRSATLSVESEIEIIAVKYTRVCTAGTTGRFHSCQPLSGLVGQSARTEQLLDLRSVRPLGFSSAHVVGVRDSSSSPLSVVSAGNSSSFTSAVNSGGVKSGLPGDQSSTLSECSS